MITMNSQTIKNALSDLNPDAVFFENMDAALIGFGTVAHHDPVAVYSKQRIFSTLFLDGFSREEATAYYLEGFVNFSAGINTPVIIDDMFEMFEDDIRG